MIRAIVVVMALGILAGCSDPQGAERTLKGAGYSSIKTGGYSWFACGKNDSYSTAFTAKGPTGIEVSGAVCRGWLFKNSTIRTE